MSWANGRLGGVGQGPGGGWHPREVDDGDSPKREAEGSGFETVELAWPGVGSDGDGDGDGGEEGAWRCLREACCRGRGPDDGEAAVRFRRSAIGDSRSIRARGDGR